MGFTWQPGMAMFSFTSAKGVSAQLDNAGTYTTHSCARLTPRDRALRGQWRVATRVGADLKHSCRSVESAVSELAFGGVPELELS